MGLYVPGPYSTMMASDSPVDMADEHTDLRSMTGLMLALDAGESIETPQTVAGEFPGSKARAMGGALELVEQLEEAGYSAEREYVGVSFENPDAPKGYASTLHRIDVHISEE